MTIATINHFIMLFSEAFKAMSADVPMAILPAYSPFDCVRRP